MKTKFFYGMTALATLGLAACSADELAPSAPGQVAEADMTRYISVQITSPSTGGTRAEGDVTPPAGYDDNDPGYNEDDNENKIDRVYFVFYDDNGNPIGGDNAIVQVENSQMTWTPVTQPNHDSSTASSVVGVSIQKGEKLPSYVLVYVNPVSPDGMAQPINVIETLKRNQVKYSREDGTGDTKVTTTYFPMSNSVYYDVNGNLVNAVKVGGLFDNMTSAENALKPDASDEDKAKVTTIHVERYAAKVQFRWKPTIDGSTTGTANDKPSYAGIKVYKYVNKDGSETINTEQTIKLEFNPEKWDVNAEGNDMYIIKAFRGSDALGGLTQKNMTLAEAEAGLGKSVNTNWIWNKYTDFRSFWSCSPAYYSTTYPEVASDYVWEDETGATVTNPSMQLKYLKWSEVKNNIGITGNLNEYATDYTLETTVGNVGLHTTLNHYAALPSIIVTGKYKVLYDEAAKSYVPDNTTFYLYGTGADNGKNIFFDAKANSLESAATEADKTTSFGASLLKRLSNRQNIVFVEITPSPTDDDKNPKPTYRELTDEEIVKIFEIAHPSQAVLNFDKAGTKNVKLAARKYSLQIKYTLDNAGNVVYDNLILPTLVDKNDENQVVRTYTQRLVINDGATGYKPIILSDDKSEAEKKNMLNEANHFVYRNVGAADKYEKGMAYFNIPIKHYGWYRPQNKNRSLNEAGTAFTDNKKIDWTLTQVGDFGIVRNHIYKISVNKVDGLATAISEETTPIIPPQETEEHYVAYRLYILNWAVVPTQNEEL